MKHVLFILAVFVVGSALSEAHAQANYRATYYGYNGSSTHWTPFADGDSLGTVTYQGHQIPTTDSFPPGGYSCTENWYQHAGQRVGVTLGTCTLVDDDGDWYRFLIKGSPDVWEGSVSCVDGTGKYEDVECEGTYRGITELGGSGWFRGEIEGTFVLK